jgi:hypothetical protein
MRGAECSHHHKPGPPTPLWQVAENSQRKNYDCVEYRGRAALQRRVEYQNQFGLSPSGRMLCPHELFGSPWIFPP